MEHVAAIHLVDDDTFCRLLSPDLGDAALGGRAKYRDCVLLVSSSGNMVAPVHSFAVLGNIFSLEIFNYPTCFDWLLHMAMAWLSHGSGREIERC